MENFEQYKYLFERCNINSDTIILQEDEWCHAIRRIGVWHAKKENGEHIALIHAGNEHVCVKAKNAWKACIYCAIAWDNGLRNCLYTVEGVKYRVAPININRIKAYNKDNYII